MENLKDQKVQLKTHIELASLINSSLDSKEIIQKAVKAAKEILDIEAASVLLIDKTTGELYFDVATGEKGQKLTRVRLKKGAGIAGWVAYNGKPLIVNDVSSDERFFSAADKVSGFKTRNIICVPLKIKSRIIGVLEGINKIKGGFSNSDLKLIKTLSNYIAISIENASLYKELKDTFYNTVEILAQVIELRDPYTGGHTKRVVDYSLGIGRYLGLPENELEDLKLAAILHDIGKIGVKDSVLLKPGRLDNAEFELMKNHTLFGTKLIKNISQLKKVVPGIELHHEKYDGSGYPHGLKGEKIPVVARIISVADAFDSMVTNRPYRKKGSKESAFKELKRCTGTQFDPVIVEAFMHVFGRKKK